MDSNRCSSIVYWLQKNLYLNITNKCSNDCYFCLRKFRKGVADFNLKLAKEPSTKDIMCALQKVMNKKRWKEIVFCGFGEPLERLDCILEVITWIRKHYGKRVSIRIDTNGQGYVYNRDRDVVKELEDVGVNKISVSLNAHNKEIYNQVCSPKFNNAFERVKEFIEKAKEKFEVEVTAVTIPEVNLLKIEELADEFGIKFRKREYIPCIW
jgi:TatD family-associated radical SAM protein